MFLLKQKETRFLNFSSFYPTYTVSNNFEDDKLLRKGIINVIAENIMTRKSVYFGLDYQPPMTKARLGFPRYTRRLRFMGFLAVNGHSVDRSR